jgi:hypothetical protein
MSTTQDALTTLLAAVAGLLIGHLHFTLLARAVARWLAGDTRGFWLRRIVCTVGAALALAVVATAGLAALLAAGLAFLLARDLHLRRAGRGGP